MATVFALSARGAPAPQRPDLAATTPLAACKLQAPAEPAANTAMGAPAVVYTATPVAGNEMNNYLRTARGEWQIPASIDRDDPWTRLLLLSPKRPLVIDLAVFIDGKPYRAAREAWIDEALAMGSSNEADAPAATAAEAKEPEKNAEVNETANPSGTSVPAESSNDQPPPDDAEKAEPTESNTESNTESSDESNAETSDETATPEIPTVAAQSRQAPAIRQRLTNYMQTIGPSVSREEVRWLLAEWGSGPPLVVLGPGLSWQRATTAPLLAYLDQDKSGNLSQAEISTIAEHLKRADADANDVLEVSEVRRADDRPLATNYSTGHPLLMPLNDSTDWRSLASDVVRIYHTHASPPAAMAAPAPAASELTVQERMRRADATLSGEDMRRLLDEPADVTLRVDFATAEGQATGVSVLAIGAALGKTPNAVTTTDDVITLDLGDDYIEFSATGGAAGGAEAAAGQIAIGAVVDGDPLLRVIDSDQDGRLTSREREDLAEFIRGLDKNGDGQASSDEIPIPIRLAITHGPNVHQMLATARPAARRAPPRQRIAAPSWFVSADKNGDGDWSPDEFLGTPEQFRQFDVDNDRRISIAEAIAAAGGE